MGSRGTETEFELTTIERFERLGYGWIHGDDLERPLDEVVLRDRLRDAIACINPDLPNQAVEQAVCRFARPDGVDTIRRNKAFHEMLTHGIEIQVDLPGGKREVRHVHAIDWNNPEANDFLVVNQLRVQGPRQNERRPDMVVYVNGLPLALFELKNPYHESPTVDDAINQIGHYRNEIPQVFDYNAITAVSDGVNTLHGMWTSPPEWFAPWKSIDGRKIEPATTASTKMLIEGLFAKDRLLDYIRNFILFESEGDRITKKGARYHQYFAVRIAAERAVRAMTTEGDRRVGVVWHTTGSGKSLSMVFLIGLLRHDPALRNPTFVVQVDRNDLDNQLHDQFVLARALVGAVKHADTVDDLRDLLRSEGGEVIFTTIEKFRLKEGEIEHEALSTRSNVLVIADEAHRSQYGFTQGYARYLAEALPKARRLGFTGTPVSLTGADTVEVFGDVIHTYDILQSQQDGATVPIYYAPRQVRLHLSRKDVDAALAEVAEGRDPGDLERAKTRWAALAAAAGAKDRLAELAQDLLAHFLDRTATLDGKAMIVCMTRANCVRMYDALTALPNCPEIKIVMTGSLGVDPPEWSAAGHLTTKNARDLIKRRMVDPQDPLKLVIVCDMWLTGTDIPCLHTLYVDKPMRGHNVIQAISRVNRVFRDKPHGLIVDYIGIGDDLREATERYTADGGEGEPAPDVEAMARPLFEACLAEIRATLPEGKAYGGWRRLGGIELEDLYALVYGTFADDSERREAFLKAEMRLSSAFLLVKHLDDCRAYADEVIFCQRVRKQLRKALPGKKLQRDLEGAVRDLVDDAVESEGVVDIFKVAGLPMADVSVLDDRFLQTFKDRPHENLRVKLLEKLLSDEINLRQRKNLAKARSFREMLEAVLAKYHNRLIDAAAVVRAMLEIRKEMEAGDARAQALGLEADELAFYDAVAENYAKVYEEAFLRDLIHDVVKAIKGNLKVDWTAPHRDDVKAAVRAAVKRVLRRRDVREQDFEPFIERFMKQAEALWADWPRAA